MSRETLVRRQGVLSKPGAAPFGNLGIGTRAGRQLLEKLLEDCSDWRSLASRRSSPRVSRLRRWFRLTFGRWLIFQSQRGRSTRRHAALVRQSANAQFPTGRPSAFPSGTDVCSRTDIRHPGCDTSCPGGHGPPIPVLGSINEDRR